MSSNEIFTRDLLRSQNMDQTLRHAEFSSFHKKGENLNETDIFESHNRDDIFLNLAELKHNQCACGVEQADVKYMKSRRTTVTSIFHAFEESDLVRLKQISEGIKKFDRYVFLDPISTVPIDLFINKKRKKSNPYLFVFMKNRFHN